MIAFWCPIASNLGTIACCSVLGAVDGITAQRLVSVSRVSKMREPGELVRVSCERACG